MAKILYVEDNEMNRDMLSRRLSRRGHEVLLAFDGQAGLDMMKSESPEIVLMDMGLPVLDGWEATTQAKADPEINMIPIIALTAHALESDKQKALECGADDFDTLEVCEAIEKDMGVKITDEQGMKIKTVQDIIDLVK